MKRYEEQDMSCTDRQHLNCLTLAGDTSKCLIMSMARDTELQQQGTIDIVLDPDLQLVTQTYNW